MIKLTKTSCATISESQKQAWIREMWEYLRDTPNATQTSMRSGDTVMLMTRTTDRIISIDEFRVHAGGDYHPEDLEKEFNG